VTSTTLRPTRRTRLGLEWLDPRCQPSAGPALPDLAVPPTASLTAAVVVAFDGSVAEVPPTLADGREAVVDWGDGVTTTAALTATGSTGWVAVWTARTLDVATTYRLTVPLTRTAGPADPVVIRVELITSDAGEVSFRAVRFGYADGAFPAPTADPGSPDAPRFSFGASGAGSPDSGVVGGGQVPPVFPAPTVPPPVAGTAPPPAAEPPAPPPPVPSYSPTPIDRLVASVGVVPAGEAARPAGEPAAAADRTPTSGEADPGGPGRLVAVSATTRADGNPAPPPRVGSAAPPPPDAPQPLPPDPNAPVPSDRPAAPQDRAAAADNTDAPRFAPPAATESAGWESNRRPIPHFSNIEWHGTAVASRPADPAGELLAALAAEPVPVAVFAAGGPADKPPPAARGKGTWGRWGSLAALAAAVLGHRYATTARPWVAYRPGGRVAG
jgi:hypothetical protein